MKFLAAIIVTSLMFGCNSKESEDAVKTHQQHSGHTHDHGHEHAESGAAPILVVETDPLQPAAGKSVTLDLMIHASDGTMVHTFDIVHQEKVHLVIISEGLEHFAHLHPEVDSSGNLRVAFTFPVGGRYRLFADHTPSGGSPATAIGEMAIAGDVPTAATPVSNSPGVIAADGLRATISHEVLKAGSSARFTFSLRNDQGDVIQLDPYMGELGHLMLIGVGNWRYVHVHPIGGDGPAGRVEFESHFSEPGLYKGWSQFKEQGRVRVVPFVVEVE